MDSQLVESVASRAEELEEASAEELAEEFEELVASRAEELEEEREEGLAEQLEERVALMVVNWAAWLAWETAYLLVSSKASALGVLWVFSTAVVLGEMWASYLVFCREFARRFRWLLSWQNRRRLLSRRPRRW